MPLSRITLDLAVMGGKPCIRGLRMTVGTVLALMASGVSRERIPAAYRELEPEDLDAVLTYAAWRREEREEEVWALPVGRDNAAPHRDGQVNCHLTQAVWRCPRRSRCRVEPLSRLNPQAAAPPKIDRSVAGSGVIEPKYPAPTAVCEPPSSASTGLRTADPPRWSTWV